MKTAQHYLKDSASGNTRGGFNTRLQGETQSENIDGARGQVWAERYAGWELADEMIRAGKIFSEIKTERGRIKFKCFPDGNAWCCIGWGFVNLQESDNYAFGDTRKEAVDSFLSTKPL